MRKGVSQMYSKLQDTETIPALFRWSDVGAFYFPQRKNHKYHRRRRRIDRFRKRAWRYVGASEIFTGDFSKARGNEEEKEKR